MTGPRRLVIDLNDARPLWRIPDRVVDAVRSALPPEWEVVVVSAQADGRGDGGGASAEALDAVRGAEVYLGYGFPRELLAAARDGGDRLRWVHSGAAGVGSMLYPEMLGSGVVLTNAAGLYAEPIAETVIGALLFFARGLDFAVRAQARRHWNKAPYDALDTPVREISGATLGIIGFGGIGRAVAARALPLGMRVVALKRTPAAAPPGVELLTGAEGLDALLRRSDFLAITAAQTAATRGLLGERELALLPRHAVLVNVARGGIVDEAALLAALRSDGLRGAALDVFAAEPLPPDSAFWETDNVLVTPHVSGASPRYWERQQALILDNLHRYLSGAPLRNVVDKHAGY